MPTYSYSCEKCGKRFARTESISAHGNRKPACPKCGSHRVIQVLRPFFAKTSKKS
jgi:putative FmdB family regulatory protein